MKMTVHMRSILMIEAWLERLYARSDEKISNEDDNFE